MPSSCQHVSEPSPKNTWASLPMNTKRPTLTVPTLQSGATQTLAAVDMVKLYPMLCGMTWTMDNALRSTSSSRSLSLSEWALLPLCTNLVLGMLCRSWLCIRWAASCSLLATRRQDLEPDYLVLSWWILRSWPSSALLSPHSVNLSRLSDQLYLNVTKLYMNPYNRLLHSILPSNKFWKV